MIKFGTGEWRAMIADGFTKANVQLLASALADLILAEHGDNPTVCIGHGHRFPGGEASRWAAEALAAKEVMCHIIDRPAPMPLIMFAVRELELPFGLGITASHNPAICSGVRVFTEGGRDAAGTVTDKLEACIRAIGAQPIPVLDFEEGKARGIIDEINPRNDFIASIMVRIDLNGIKNAHLKVALDPMWGVSHTSLRTILLAARCDVHVIRDRRDPFCGDKLPAPGGDTLKALSDTVKDHQCDFGIATDGDGDRLGVVDDQGFFVHPNHLLALLSYYLLEYKGWKGPVVRNVTTTHLLDRVAAAYGQVCYEVPVGFRHISAKMEETDAVIGGEASGGLMVRGHIYGKNGIYAASLLTEMVAKTGKQISVLRDEILSRFGAAASHQQ